MANEDNADQGVEAALRGEQPQQQHMANNNNKMAAVSSSSSPSSRRLVTTASVSRMAATAAGFTVTANDLAALSNERTRLALALTLEKGVKTMIRQNSISIRSSKNITATDAVIIKDTTTNNSNNKVANANGSVTGSTHGVDNDPETFALIERMKHHNRDMDDDVNGHDASHQHQSKEEADHDAEVAANYLTNVLLKSSVDSGISEAEVEKRRTAFGTNAIAEKELASFLHLCWESVQDFVLIMLIILGFIILGLEVSTKLEKGEGCKTCWIEGTAILLAVMIVVLVTASIDYAKQFAFLRLAQSLHESNTKQVIRDGKQLTVIDDDIVVGDILSVNSHSLATVPADCILLGPAAGLKMNESSLTGESDLILKRPGDVVLSGTNAVQGTGKMVVIAVGVNSVAGRIKARVYDSQDAGGELTGDDEGSPLEAKLERLAQIIGMGGTIAASVAFIGSCLLGLWKKKEDPEEIVDYMIVAITVLAVAVPEGLPLAVTLALAFSSMKMMKEHNLVKHLAACETMGSATTICTDKTGTLTANRMTSRALYTGQTNYVVDNPALTLGEYVHQMKPEPSIIDLICKTVAIDTMNESVLVVPDAKDNQGVASNNETNEGEAKQTKSSGNPTELALLHLVHGLGGDYNQIRNGTKGRAEQGPLAEFRSHGKQFGFSSARKMMSWAIPTYNDQDEIVGYRLYCKGASEVVLARCTTFVNSSGTLSPIDEQQRDEFVQIGLSYARRGMRTLTLAYRDVDVIDLEEKTPTVKNSDGSDAFVVETEMSAIALVGIEDPIRPEVPTAINKCYRAGIDVRMVTGDNPNTAVSIAYQAGILRDFHFKEGTTERVAGNLKENVLMEGKAFRKAVNTPKTVVKPVVGDEAGENEIEHDDEAEEEFEFNQAEFDKIWPHLRVLARSSPEDKLTLAHGLNQSNLFQDKEVCIRLQKEDQITIFPDRQVVAMTGDGTNDAPALKRADIGFAMGISGTQIAKDAADIILMDDNFASIVTAAKWGRNIYASIQKFLQFQLTVNISAVITALVGAFYQQTSPLAAIQLLWVNLLMDSLASLALASEPPVEELLYKPPVNRTASMITERMWVNMLGQALYQVTVIMLLLFKGPDWLDIEPGHEVEEEEDEGSEHYTIIFNTFVWMQLFNELNCRKLKGELNIFTGILQNPLFIAILVSTGGLQVLIVQKFAVAFHVVEGGLSLERWCLCMALGAGSLPVQQLINLLNASVLVCLRSDQKGQ